MLAVISVGFVITFYSHKLCFCLVLVCFQWKLSLHAVMWKINRNLYNSRVGKVYLILIDKNIPLYNITPIKVDFHGDYNSKYCTAFYWNKKELVKKLYVLPNIEYVTRKK